MEGNELANSVSLGMGVEVGDGGARDEVGTKARAFGWDKPFKIVELMDGVGL